MIVRDQFEQEGLYEGNTEISQAAINVHPNRDGNNLKDVERIQHFEQQQLHNDDVRSCLFLC